MKEQKQTKKKSKLKVIGIILISLVLLIVIIIGIVVPVYISSESGNKTILTKINNTIDGKAEFSSLSMGWLKGIKLKNFSYNDPANQTFVRINEITTKPHYGSLILGNMSFGRTVIDKPQVQITLPEPIEKEKAETEKTKSGKPAKLPVQKIDLIVQNGDITITDSKANSIHLTGLNSRVNLKGQNQKNDFNLEANIANGYQSSKVTAEGNINPAKISGQLSVNISDLDIAKLNPILDLLDVDLQTSGKIAGELKSEFQSKKIKSLDCDIRGSNLDIKGSALKGDRIKTSSLTMSTQLSATEDLIDITKCEVQTDWVTIAAAGKLPTSSKSFSDFLSPDKDSTLDCAFEVDVPAVTAQLPNTLKINEKTKVTKGRLVGKIKKTTKASKATINADAQLIGLAGIVEGKIITLDQPIVAKALINSDKSGISYETIQASSSFAQINCSGTDKLLAYELSANLGKLQNEIGRFIDTKQYSAQGQLTSKGQITNKKDIINITGSSSVANLLIKTPKGETASEPKADFAMNIDIDRDTSDLKIKTAQLAANLGNIKINNASIPGSKNSKLAMSLPIEADIDLEKARSFALLVPAYPKKLSLSGQAVSKLSVTKKADDLRIVTDSTQIKNLTYATPNTEPASFNLVNATLDARIGKTKNIITCKLSAPGQIEADCKYEKIVTGKTSSLNAKVDCDSKEQYLTQLISAFMPKDLKMLNTKAGVELTSKYPTDQPDKLWANLTTTKPAKISFDRVEFMGFVAPEPSSIQANFDKGALDIPGFSIKVNDGTLNFAGQADFNQKKTILKVRTPRKILDNVKIDEEISLRLLKILSPIFNDVQRVSGYATLDCNELQIPLKGATKKDLVMTGNFYIKDMLLQSEIFNVIQKVGGKPGRYNKMEVMPTRITAQNGLVSYDNMQLNVDDNPFNFIGRIDLATKSIEGSKVKTPYTTGRTIKIGEENTEGRITASFKGRYDSPEIDWGKTLFEDNLKNILKEGLKKNDINIGDILENL